MKNIIIKYLGLLLPLFAILTAVSCDDEKSYPDTSAYKTVISGIKIINGGVGGTETITGSVDENTKEITFPEVDMDSDLSAVRFEVELSEGATLDEEEYDFTVSEGSTKTKRTIAVMNGPRKREYFVTIQLDVPVWGADFSSPIVYDYSAATDGNIYPTFISQLTRGTSFNGEYVLIISRTNASQPVTPHLLKVSDLKNKSINPVSLNLSGITGGTYTYNTGAIVNNRIYISSLSGSVASPLKIYCWNINAPGEAPQVLLNQDKAEISGIGTRHGDNMSVNIDKNGNGFIFFADNAATQVLRYTVTNHTTIGNPTILPKFTNMGFTASFNQVEGTDDYIFTAHEAAIFAADAGGKILFTMNSESVPVRGCDARVIEFNSERYLIMCTAARSGDDSVIFYVYDITKGNGTVEALALFDESVDKSPVYQFALGGKTNAAPITQTGYYVEKDTEANDLNLYLYAAGTDNGFMILEFPKKVKETAD